jgi:hypothetical protein
MTLHRLPFAVALLTLTTPAFAATLKVGPGQTYATPCAAIAAASAGDVIEADAAGSYTGDTCSWTTDNLTVRGVNGMAKIDDTGVAVADTKGIFVVYATNATIENFELTGAAISSAEGNNGAGIRHEGINLVVRGCYIHDNQDGVLGVPVDATGTVQNGQGAVLIENSEFSHNGAGDGESHNMYLGKYATFTLQFSYSHDANVGHLVKSRAYTSLIQYNRLTDETGGMASYEIDLPVAGTAYVLGNIIEQSPTAQNDNILSYGEEPQNVIDPDTHLFVVNNTFLNDYGRGTFVHVDAGITTPALVLNNIFAGGGTDCDESSATLTTNFDDPANGDPMFVDQATYDVELMAGSPCIDKGTLPGSNGGQSLVPTYEYVQPESGAPRHIEGSAIDIGAYEYGNPDGGLSEAGVTAPDGGPAPKDGGANGKDGGVSGSKDGGGVSHGKDAGVDAKGPVTTPLGDGGAGDAAVSAVASNVGGCGCSAAGFAPRAGFAWAMLPIALLARRRRRVVR